MLIETPRAIASSIAGRPSRVAGILISTFGRSTWSCSAIACSNVSSVLFASVGSTSSET